MRPIEFNGTIGRTTDISPMKQAEDAKPQTDQQNMMQVQERNVQEHSEQVHEKEDSASGEFDAKNGRGGSAEEQKKKRQKREIEEKGVVRIKSSARFDIKI